MTGVDPAPLASRAGTPDPTLPFFAYGIFAPGQIAFFQIKTYVHDVTDASVTGILLIRDGVPVLDTTAQGEVANGHLITFNDDADAECAYQAIQDMEPRTQYRWRTHEEMNFLAGFRPKRGSRPIPTDADGNPDWSSWRDPAFLDALEVVEENLAKEFVWNDLRHFYRLQGAYMALWSSIERYVSLRYGLGRNEQVRQRVMLLAEEPRFEASLRATEPSATGKLRKLFRSDDPEDNETFDPVGPPGQAIDYLYQMRSNVTHRGKAVHRRPRTNVAGPRSRRANRETEPNGRLHEEHCWRIRWRILGHKTGADCGSGCPKQRGNKMSRQQLPPQIRKLVVARVICTMPIASCGGGRSTRRQVLLLGQLLLQLAREVA